MGRIGRRACNTDSNHQEVMKALRAAGMEVVSTASVGGGFVDLACGWRGLNLFFEVKDGDKVPSKQALTVAEQEFHATWPGQIAIVRSGEEAVIAATLHAKAMGVI